MSISVIEMVWSHSTQKSGNLLVLLAIADNAWDSGYAYPGVDYLAAKTRMSPRNVQRCIRNLEAAGELRCDIGAGPHGCNAYYVLPNLLRPDSERATNCHPAAPTTRKGDTHDRARVTPTTPTGDAHATRTVREPSGESSNKPNPLVPLSGDEEFWLNVVFKDCFRQEPRPPEARILRQFRTGLPHLDKAHAHSLERFYRAEPLGAKEPPFSSRKHSPERLLAHLPSQLALAATTFPPPPAPPPEPEGWRDALRILYPRADVPDSFHAISHEAVKQDILRHLAGA